MSEGPRYPFAFFGVEPTDWFDLENDLFSYEIRFAAAPDAEARRAIGDAWERGLDQRAVEIVEPFVWADRWALARARPAGWSRACLADMARAVQRAMIRVHGVCPIEQVILAEAIESDGDWDAWSLEQTPEPEAGPRWPVTLPKAGSGERFEAAAAVDPEVEQARARARASLSEEEAPGAPRGASDEDGDEDEDGDAREPDAAQEGTGPKVLEGDLRLLRRPRDEVKEKVASQEERKLFGSRAEIAVAPNGTVYGVAKPRRRPLTAAWIEDGALRTAEGEPLPQTYGPSLAARDDSEAALIVCDDEGAFEVVFAEGRLRRLFDHKESISDAAYGPDGRIVLLAGRSIDVYRREGAEAELEKRWDINGYNLRAVRGGRLLFVSCYEDGDDGISVLGFDGSTLRRLARIVCSVSELVAAEGRVLVVHYGDEEEELHEIVGWEALLDRLDADPGAFPEVREHTGDNDDEDEDEDEASGDEESGDQESDDEESDDEASDDEDEDSDDEAGDDEDSDSEDDEEDGDDEEEAPRAGRKRGAKDLAVPPAPGRVGLVSLGRASPLPSGRAAAIPKEVRAALAGVGDIERAGDGELYYGWKKDGRRSYRFVALCQGALVETEVRAKASSPLSCVSWDRARILVPSDDDSKLWLVELPSGNATLVWDFAGGDEDEVYSLEILAHDRILVATMSEVWLLSMASGAAVIEARGALDLQDVEAACEGRAIVLCVGEDRPLRVWGVYEGGVRVLAELELDLSRIEAHEGRIFVQADGNAGWYEVVNLEDAWRAARDDPSSEPYPRLHLAPAERDDEDEDEDDDDDDA